MTARYVIAKWFPTGCVDRIVELPDAEHVHVTRKPDGTYSAKEMEEQTFPPSTWESVARLFHRNYEDLAPEFGYATRPESAVAWADVPEQNRALMIATVGQTLRDLLDKQRLWVDRNEP